VPAEEGKDIKDRFTKCGGTWLLEPLQSGKRLGRIVIRGRGTLVVKAIRKTSGAHH